MILYEVNLSVVRLVETEFRAWLTEHVERVLKSSPGFLEAKIFCEEVSADSAHVNFVAHYYLDTRESLEKYFLEKAPALRQEGIDKFGKQFTSTRRVLVEFIPR